MMNRVFRKEDLEKCIALFIDVFNRSPWNNQWTSETAEGFFKDFIDTPGFVGYVTVDDTELIVACMIGKEKKWWKGKELFIEEFFVQTELQGQGIGTNLLEFTLEEMKGRGIRNITLLTDHLASAYKFYRNKDFKENSALRLLYKDI